MNPPTSKFKLHTSSTQEHLTQWLPTSKKKSNLTSKLKPQSLLKPLRTLAFKSKKHLALLTSKVTLLPIEKKKSGKNGLRITTVLALALIAVAATCTTYAALSVSKNVSSSGSVAVSANLGVYSDSACQNALTTIDWGTLTPGGNIIRTIYVKNTGMGTSLSLSMATSNWNPTSANGPVTITWNQGGTRLAPGQSIAAVITLVVSPTITDITSFSVQVTITGTQ